MQKIMFNERYGLQSAVLEGRKTQTRREPFYSAESVCCEFNRQGKLECVTYDDEKEYPIHTSRYAKGEIVAVAQSYSDIFDESYNDYFNDIYSNFRNAYVTKSKGWNNKMFVKAELMPHHIKITNIRCERLQDISDEDCVREGIEPYYPYGKNDPVLIYRIFAHEPTHNKTRIDACYRREPQIVFSYLISKLNGKKFWESNPYVIVYEFELIN